MARKFGWGSTRILPEAGQSTGTRPPSTMSPLKAGTVSVEMMDKEHYGRIVGIVEGCNVNEELVRDAEN